MSVCVSVFKWCQVFCMLLYVSFSFVFILRVCERTTHSFILSIAMPKEQEEGSSVTTVTVNDDSGAAISLSINQ